MPTLEIEDTDSKKPADRIPIDNERTLGRKSPDNADAVNLMKRRALQIRSVEFASREPEAPR